MKRTMVVAMATTLAWAGLANAQAGEVRGSASGAAQGTVQSTPSDASAQAAASARADASTQTDIVKLGNEIRAKGARVSAKARSRAEATMSATAKKVDAEAAKGESRLAARLAAEFDATTQGMLDEKASLGASWGELMIAHTLAANSKQDVTAAQLLMIQHDGMGWGQISAGLGLNLGQTVSAVRSEGRVAMGSIKADGKVAAIHGEGARVGLGTTTGLTVGATRGVGAGVNAGVNVGVGK
jgi:hypothetical protein